MLEAAFDALDKNNDSYLDFYELAECMHINNDAFKKVKGP